MGVIFGHLNIAYADLLFPCETGLYDCETSIENCPEASERFIEYPSAPLSLPLKQGELNFKRRRTVYSVHFSLLAKEAYIFENLSEPLREKFGDKWSELGPDGEAYILDGNNQKYISIFEPDSNIRERLISLGSFGAISRTFRDFDSFKKDAKNLEKVVNILIETCFAKAGNVKKFKELEKSPIFVNC